MTPAEHIIAAARQFRDGETCYYAVKNNDKQTLDNFHRALYKAMARRGLHGWTFHKADTKTVYIKP